MEWLQISVSTTSECAELVSMIMYDAGSEGVLVMDDADVKELVEKKLNWDYVDEKLMRSLTGKAVVSGFFSVDFSAAEIERGLASLKENSVFPVGSLEVSSVKIDSADWENEWRKYYNPINLGKVVVVPAWQKAPDGAAYPVYIEPGMAFGTGNHETTSMCIELMQDLELKDKTVLDMGCGSVLYQQRYQNATRKQDCYICGSYKKRTRDCTAHFIRTDLLTAGVTDNLRKVTSYAAKHEARFMKLLIEQNEDGGKRRNAARKKELEAAEKRISELSAIFKRLYEDSVTGRISDERFTELSADYEAEQKELKERAAAIRAELSKAQEATVNAEKFMNVVRKYTSFEELTPTLLREFVEKIVVHECSYDENGTRRQDIDIYYSFVGKVDLPE